ncbi:MAG: flotillin family protein [Armatimonadota bacterium]
MGFIFLMIIAGLGMLATPLFVEVGNFEKIILSGFGLFLFVVGIVIWAYSSLYQKTSAEEALVRTGSGGSKVVIDGGTMVWPIVHKVTRVSLKVIKLTSVREGQDALITKDYLRADVHSEFYMRVGATPEQVLNAARSFGAESGQEDAIDNKVGDKLISALRSVAAKHELAELHSDRESFAIAVQELVSKEIEPNGLILETVTISRLDQTDPSHLNDNNVFDAQGKRKITEITTAAQVARNILDRSAEQAMTEKDVSTRKSVLTMQQDQAFAEAEQRMQVNKVQSEKQREADVYKIEQEQQTQQAQIFAEQAVKQSDIAREQKIQTTEVERVRAVEVATRDQQIAVVQKEVERAAAEQSRFEAEAAREQANQAVKTVEVVASAEREARQKLIAAENEAQQALVRKQREADSVAYQKSKEAEGELMAANSKAKATLTMAEAEAQAKARLAEGEKAIQVVPVLVAAEQVDVSRKQMEVDKSTAEFKQQFEKSSIEFELGKLEIEAKKEIQIALANAIGNFTQKGNYTVYGTPDTMAEMLEKLSKGLGIGAFMDGFGKSMFGENGNGNGHERTPSDTVDDLATMLGAVVKKVTGKEINLTPETTQQIASLVKAYVPAIAGNEVEEKTETKAVVKKVAGPKEG